jgi:hypothetical protein
MEVGALKSSNRATADKLPTNLPSNGDWNDETQTFNMKAVCATLRDSNAQPGELVRNYNWYPDAVSIDALLPPGLPLSAKEINAYYPHHVRWKDVMIRLTRNGYRGSDILAIQVRFLDLHIAKMALTGAASTSSAETPKITCTQQR